MFRPFEFRQETALTRMRLALNISPRSWHLLYSIKCSNKGGKTWALLIYSVVEGPIGALLACVYVLHLLPHVVEIGCECVYLLKLPTQERWIWFRSIQNFSTGP